MIIERSCARWWCRVYVWACNVACMFPLIYMQSRTCIQTAAKAVHPPYRRHCHVKDGCPAYVHRYTGTWGVTLGMVLAVGWSKVPGEERHHDPEHRNFSPTSHLLINVYRPIPRAPLAACRGPKHVIEIQDYGSLIKSLRLADVESAARLSIHSADTLGVLSLADSPLPVSLRGTRGQNRFHELPVSA